MQSILQNLLVNERRAKACTCVICICFFIRLKISLAHCKTPWFPVKPQCGQLTKITRNDSETIWWQKQNSSVAQIFVHALGTDCATCFTTQHCLDCREQASQTNMTDSVSTPVPLKNVPPCSSWSEHSTIPQNTQFNVLIPFLIPSPSFFLNPGNTLRWHI